MSQIVLVGASNVGKSSIFNHLTESKNAIISPIAGTTRDRIFGEMLKDDHRISICDTGGLGDASLAFSEDFQTQAKIAIEHAEVIWFIVDGALPEPTSIDRELARSLRAHHKPILYVVNKMDQQTEVNGGFYELGFSDIYPVSTRTKKGFEALIDATMPLIDLGSQNNIDYSISIVGRPNVGKSTWINALIKTDRLITSDEAGTTRDAINIELDYKGEHIRLIDTAGIHERKKDKDELDFFAYIRTMRAIHQADFVCLMIDGGMGLLMQDKKLMNELIQIGKPFFILVNKKDLIADIDELAAELDYLLPKHIAITYASGVKRTGKKQFFDEIQSLKKQSRRTFTTNKLNKILADVVAKHEPPIVQNRRIKLRYMHQIQQSPRVFKIHGKQTKKLPKTYIRYLENAFRSRLELPSIPIRFFFKEDHNPYV